MPPARKTIMDTIVQSSNANAAWTVENLANKPNLCVLQLYFQCNAPPRPSSFSLRFLMSFIFCSREPRVRRGKRTFASARPVVRFTHTVKIRSIITIIITIIIIIHVLCESAGSFGRPNCRRRRSFRVRHYHESTPVQKTATCTHTSCRSNLEMECQKSKFGSSPGSYTRCEYRSISRLCHSRCPGFWQKYVLSYFETCAVPQSTRRLTNRFCSPRARYRYATQ